MPETCIISWSDGTWVHPPAAVQSNSEENGALEVTVAEGSDAWRHTAYGFVHDSAPALLAPLAVGEAMEVTFHAAWEGEFDQAGLFVRIDEEHWAKTGVEYADGHLGLGAVVTAGKSDWSVGQVDQWREHEITVRVSRWADSLVVRARAADEPWRLVRVAPFDGAAAVFAGPFAAAPTRAGLTVHFTRWERSAADTTLH